MLNLYFNSQTENFKNINSNYAVIALENVCTKIIRQVFETDEVLLGHCNK